jgi:hypothetical protein
MGEGDKSGGEVKKLSRLEREQEKIRVAQTNIDRILASEKEKQGKRDTHQKVLLGVILQGMIADGAVSSDLFDRSLEKYLTRERDRELCDAYFDEHRPSSQKT